jgi:cyclopropane fatty-acyl-phospholipid synthase-like methyltransferase
MLERCRFLRLPELKEARRVLVMGDGDGRFLARLLDANRELMADVVDGSAAMLRLLERRVDAVGARQRIAIHHLDAMVFEPAGMFDLVATHFFLDCLTTVEVEALARRVRAHVGLGGRWVVSEFAVPVGPGAMAARAVIAGLYAAFGVMTGLRVRRLPDYASALEGAGFVLEDRRRLMGGLLVSDVWRA